MGYEREFGLLKIKSFLPFSDPQNLAFCPIRVKWGVQLGDGGGIPFGLESN